MKLAFVSDIHGNLTALEAVVADLERESPDLVIHGGDLALNGPQPAECVAMIRELGWAGILGNTDDIAVRGASRAPLPQRLLVGRLVRATQARLGPDHLAWLGSLPRAWSGHGVALTHATPGDLWRVVPAEAPDETLASVYGVLGEKLAVYCHIHVPFVRVVSAGEKSLTVCNSGSVGLPFDGDPRSAYLVVADGTPQVRRVAYDVERAAAAVTASGYPWASHLAASYRTGRR